MGTLKQYKELKAKHPDRFLLFRMGDFYETYQEDAKIASEVLGITLTRRSDNELEYLAGFPYMALDTYLPKLIRAGHKVAICDELEVRSERYDVRSAKDDVRCAKDEVRTSPLAPRTSTLAPRTSPTYNISIAMLRAYLTECSEAYYQDAVSIIDDAEYDRLNNLLRELERKNGADVPSMDKTIITDHVDGFKKVRHSTMMHSQRDIYTEEELNKWMEEMREITMRERGLEATFTVEPKYDGLSCSLIYENGNLVRAATRGDGWEGDDVTAQVMNLPSVPKSITGDICIFGTFEVRGEIVMPFEAFERVNKELIAQGKEPLANPRNAASGALKSLDPTVARDRGLEFIAWDAIPDRSINIDCTNKSLIDNLVCDFYTCIQRSDSESVYGKVKEMCQDRSLMRYAIDGVVVKLNQRFLWNTIGMTGKYPKYSVAFKFPQESKYSKLVSVDWQVAATGKVTPVANYEPIQMNGTTCQRATMNSLRWIDENLNGIHIGDELELIKGGEIIPKILGYRTSADRGMEVRHPHNCPVCGSRLIQKGAHLWCENPECGAKGVRGAKGDVRSAKGEGRTSHLSHRTSSLTPFVPKFDIAGKKILVSGNFGTPQMRKQIEASVFAAGATLAKSVTLDTDYFILPDDIEEWKHKAGGKWQSIQSYMKQNCIRKASEVFEC